VTTSPRGSLTLALARPDLLAEWDTARNIADGLDPDRLGHASRAQAHWKCVAHGHRWQAKVANRTAKSSGCPYCCGAKLLVGFNDLATTRSDLAPQFSPRNAFGPTEVMAGSGKSVIWRCGDGHEWVTSPNLRRLSKGCPVCCRAQPPVDPITVRLNSLAATFPALAAEWSPANERTADAVQRGSRYVATWICSTCSHTWRTRVSYRTNKGHPTGCPACSRASQIGSKQRRRGPLAVEFPELVAEWDPANNRTPDDVTAGSRYRAQWVCAEGHRWTTRITNRTYRSTGCPDCSNPNRLPTIGVNDLASRYPDLAAEFDSDTNGVSPDRIAVHSGRVLDWTCAECDHRWSARPAERVRGEKRCPNCSTIQATVVRGVNDLATTHPQLITEWVSNVNGRTARDVSAGSHIVVTWRCAHQHQWQAAVYNRAAGSGCPQCAGRGA
jgi:uncharacterized protein YlaI